MPSTPHRHAYVALPKCARCLLRPEQIVDVVDDAKRAGLTPHEYVEQRDSTYNELVKLFVCPECYRALGSPTVPGWKPRRLYDMDERAEESAFLPRQNAAGA